MENNNKMYVKKVVNIYIYIRDTTRRGQKTSECHLGTNDLSGASAFVGSITGSKWPETNNFLLKLVSLYLFSEMKAIPCEKLPRN
jgi:hypothetical protein